MLKILKIKINRCHENYINSLKILSGKFQKFGGEAAEEIPPIGHLSFPSFCPLNF